MISISFESLLILALVAFIVGMIVGISLSRPRLV
jgi:uncharacterized membrane protein